MDRQGGDPEADGAVAHQDHHRQRPQDAQERGAQPDLPGVPPERPGRGRDRGHDPHRQPDRAQHAAACQGARPGGGHLRPAGERQHRHQGVPHQEHQGFAGVRAPRRLAARLRHAAGGQQLQPDHPGRRHRPRQARAAPDRPARPAGVRGRADQDDPPEVPGRADDLRHHHRPVLVARPHRRRFDAAPGRRPAAGTAEQPRPYAHGRGRRRRRRGRHQRAAGGDHAPHHQQPDDPRRADDHARDREADLGARQAIVREQRPDLPPLRPQVHRPAQGADGAAVAAGRRRRWRRATHHGRRRRRPEHRHPARAGDRRRRRR